MASMSPMMMCPVITVGKNKPRGYYDYPYQTSLALGMVHITLGATAIGLEIAAMAIHTPFSYIAPGIWCGLVYIADGALAIAAARIKSRSMVVTFLILALVAAQISIALFIVCPLGLEKDTVAANRDSRKLGLNGALVAIGILDSLFNIWSAIIAGRWLCKHALPSNDNISQAPLGKNFQGSMSNMAGNMMMLPSAGNMGNSGMIMVPMMPQQPMMTTQQASTVTSMQLGESMVFNPLGGVGANYVSNGFHDTMGSRKSLNYKNSTRASGRGSTTM